MAAVLDLAQPQLALSGGHLLRKAHKPLVLGAAQVDGGYTVLVRTKPIFGYFRGVDGGAGGVLGVGGVEVVNEPFGQQYVAGFEVDPA
eukprot:CAMPEP_0173218558 /NCGR_PEP_ID=MMETSP1142-20121109/1119_1 /TAXON_ID=483371 /ORGANISM="non described non described, Strain CCMP2298" /LENGTH=87 /DNA_ID=CAMNT_0014146265 /DNA_START=44 /DNA_END=304 /DNA_ORIENTATION=-